MAKDDLSTMQEMQSQIIKEFETLVAAFQVTLSAMGISLINQKPAVTDDLRVLLALSREEFEKLAIELKQELENAEQLANLDNGLLTNPRFSRLARLIEAYADFYKSLISLTETQMEIQTSVSTGLANPTQTRNVLREVTEQSLQCFQHFNKTLEESRTELRDLYKTNVPIFKIFKENCQALVEILVEILDKVFGPLNPLQIANSMDNVWSMHTINRSMSMMTRGGPSLFHTREAHDVLKKQYASLSDEGTAEKPEGIELEYMAPRLSSGP